MSVNTVMRSNRNDLKDWKQNEKVKRIPISFGSINKVIPSEHSVEDVCEES